MNFAIPDQRIRRGAPATLTVTLADQDGTAVDAAGVLTVAVAKADGTVVLTAGTATGHGPTGVYTVGLTAAQTATLELLTASWTDAGNGTVWTTTHEIAGGYFVSVADVRAFDTDLADPGAFPGADILEARRETEDECENICDVAFVPRYRRVTLAGTASPELVLPDNRLRRLRSARIYTSPTAFTSLTADQLAAVAATDDNRLVRTNFDVWPEGVGNIVLEYEHGHDALPAGLRTAVLVRLRSQLAVPNSGINDRAKSLSGLHGEPIELDTADVYRTGIPEVDAAYARHSMRSRQPADSAKGGGQDSGVIAAGRRLDFDPQYWSLFHGGRR